MQATCTSTGCNKEKVDLRVKPECPSTVPSFNWFRPDEPITPKKVCSIRRDEVPIPALPNPYPYRYSSAGPSESNRSKKQWDIRRCLLEVAPREKPGDKIDPMNISQVRGYETTTLTESLRPFRSRVNKNEFISTGIPKGIFEPIMVPYRAHSEFDQYVNDFLHPNWKKDILYQRRVQFHMKFKDEW